MSSEENKENPKILGIELHEVRGEKWTIKLGEVWFEFRKAHNLWFWEIVGASSGEYTAKYSNTLEEAIAKAEAHAKLLVESLGPLVGWEKKE